MPSSVVRNGSGSMTSPALVGSGKEVEYDVVGEVLIQLIVKMRKVCFEIYSCAAV